MSDVHFDTPKTPMGKDEIKEIIAMQGATIIATAFVEKAHTWFLEGASDEQPEARIKTELLKDVIKDIKAALLDK